MFLDYFLLLGKNEFWKRTITKRAKRQTEVQLPSGQGEFGLFKKVIPEILNRHLCVRDDAVPGDVFQRIFPPDIAEGTLLCSHCHKGIT